MPVLVLELHCFKLRLPLYSSKESRFSKMLKVKQKSEFLNFSETSPGISELTTNPVTYLRNAFFISATTKNNDLYGKFFLLSFGSNCLLN